MGANSTNKRPPLDPAVRANLVQIERFSVPELFERFIQPGTKESYSYDEVVTDLIPAMAVFERVPIESAFEYLSDTVTLEEWTLSVRNMRIEKGDIYVGDEPVSQTGKVYVQTVADRNAKTIGWSCGHDSPEDLWLWYRGLLIDAQGALGRPGTALIWTNFFHEKAKVHPVYKGTLKFMFAAHRLEIANLKMILEARYGGR